MKIGVLFPSKNRPDKFKQALESMMSRLSGKNHVKVYVVVDADDRLLNEYHDYISQSEYKQHLSMTISTTPGKIKAVNKCAKMALDNDMDLIAVMSDDMDCVKDSWDEVIGEYADRFGLDNSFYFSDGFTYPRLNTMPIVGNPYLRRFVDSGGNFYIYHPSYDSLWCDNEFTDVSRALGRSVESSTVLFKHMNPLNDHRVPKDSLFVNNNKYNDTDMKNYKRRKEANWPA